MSTVINAGRRHKAPPQLPTDDEIVVASERYPDVDEDRRGIKGFAYPKEAPIVFIKCDDEGFGIMEEIRNQAFVFDILEQMPQEDRAGIRVPEIYRVVKRDYKVHIVMDYVHGETVKELLEKGTPDDQLEECFDQIAKAIKLFLSIKVHAGTPPGPVGGGLIRHPLFRDCVASMEYASVDELQKHVFNVANKFKRNNLTIDFSKESLCFCYSDLYEGNVMFTDTGTLYIIDFEHAAFLPTSFMTLSLSLDRPINEALRNKLSLPQENLNAMQAARYYFQISGHGVGLPLDDPWRDIKRKRRSPNAHQPPNPMSDNTEHLPSGCRTNSTESDA